MNKRAAIRGLAHKIALKGYGNIGGRLMKVAQSWEPGWSENQEEWRVDPRSFADERFNDAMEGPMANLYMGGLTPAEARSTVEATGDEIYEVLIKIGVPPGQAAKARDAAMGEIMSAIDELEGTEMAPDETWTEPPQEPTEDEAIDDIFG